MATNSFPSSQSISPSVRIIERDLSFVNSSLSFSKTAMVGFCSKGPINTPTLVRTLTELYETFGYPHPSSSASYLIYSAIEFLRKGQQLYIVRVADTEPTSATYAETAKVDVASAGQAAKAVSENAGNITLDPSIASSWNFRFRVNGVTTPYKVSVAAGIYTVTSLAAEVQQQLDNYGDDTGIRVSSDATGHMTVETSNMNGPSSSVEFVSVENDLNTIVGLGTGRTAGVVNGVADRYPLGNSDAEFDLGGLSSLYLQIVVYGSGNSNIDGVTQIVPITASDGRTALDIVNEINTYVAANLPGGFTASVNAGKITLTTKHVGRDAKIQVKTASTADTVLGLPNTAGIGTSPIRYTGDADVYVGGYVYGIATGGATNTITFKADSPGIEGNNTQVKITTDTETGRMTLEVFNNGVNVETWSNLTKDETDTTYYIETFLENNSMWLRAEDNTSTEERPANGIYSLSGGTDGIPTTASAANDLIVGESFGNTNTGLHTLDEPERIDIDLVAVPGNSSTDVILAMIDLCENRRQDCMCIIDPPFGMSASQVKRWHNGISPLNTTKLNSNYAALYWPWIQVRDTINKVDVWIPPSGAVLGVYAYSESAAEVWYAPAGLERGTIDSALDVEYMPYQEERDSLYGNQNAINTLVKFPDEGVVVWGEKTLQRRPTALDRVNVRRLLLYCEKRIKANTRHLIFEPDDEELYERFTNIANTILSEVKTKRGVNDYIIKCDDELNTAETRDRNEVRARIGIQPTHSAEFFFIEFSIHRTGTFEESGALFD